jgi:hypothetical protein
MVSVALFTVQGNRRNPPMLSDEMAAQAFFLFHFELLLLPLESGQLRLEYGQTQHYTDPVER